MLVVTSKHSSAIKANTHIQLEYHAQHYENLALGTTYDRDSNITTAFSPQRLFLAARAAFS